MITVNSYATHSELCTAYLHLSVLRGVMQRRPSPVVLKHLGPHTQKPLQDPVVPGTCSEMQSCRPLLVLARQADVGKGSL